MTVLRNHTDAGAAVDIPTAATDGTRVARHHRRAVRQVGRVPESARVRRVRVHCRVQRCRSVVGVRGDRRR